VVIGFTSLLWVVMEFVVVVKSTVLKIHNHVAVRYCLQ